MKLTRLAILARFNQDHTKAFAYCHRMSSESKNPLLRTEYREHARWIWANAESLKTKAAHA
jgi:hypothetical protein